MIKQAKAFFAYPIAVVWAIAIILPFVWALRISLIPTFTTFVSFFPECLADLSLVNYRFLLFETRFLRWVLNSVIISGSATFLNVLISLMLGYVLARKRLPGSNIIFTIVLALLMVPLHILVIALFLGLVRVGLVNTLIGVILPLSANAFGVFLMRQYILMIPPAYEEAALVDGCSQAGAIFRIVLPQTLPAIGILTITMLIETWNNFILPLVMLMHDPMRTVTLGVASLVFLTLNVNWGVLMAASLLGAAPTVIVFIVFNRYFLRGLTLHGGLK